jgi:ankyrin repeat protein
MKGLLVCIKGLLAFASSLYWHQDDELYACLQGCSSLIFAACAGQLEVLKYLCCLGNAELLSHRDATGKSAVGWAEEAGHMHVAEYLRSVGVQQ